jgi:16S rRNA (guanine527-N7)-methyltransferase
VDWVSFRAEAARLLGRDLTAAELDALRRLHDLLIAGNERAALTTVTDLPGFLRSHLLDSLAVARAVASEPAPPRTLVDIGSGAGFPALPLAIAFPDLAVTAVESVRKKAAFINETAAALGLGARVRAVEIRAEELGRDPAHRDRHDLATARALAPFPVLVELALPFLRPGGLLVALKGADEKTSAEIAAGDAALRELSGKLERVLPAEVPGLDHRLVCVRKEGPTPERYPRRTGIPEKRPLR